MLSLFSFALGQVPILHQFSLLSNFFHWSSNIKSDFSSSYFFNSFWYFNSFILFHSSFQPMNLLKTFLSQVLGGDEWILRHDSEYSLVVFYYESFVIMMSDKDPNVSFNVVCFMNEPISWFPLLLLVSKVTFQVIYFQTRFIVFAASDSWLFWSILVFLLAFY